MMTLKKILHPTDFTDCAEGAFQFAVELAARFRAELHVLHVRPGLGADTFFDLDDLSDQGRSESAEWANVVAQMEKDLRPLRGKATFRRIGGYSPLAGPAIVDYARQSGTDLVVLGACGRGADTEKLGIAAREVIHRAPCPVLTVHGQAVTQESLWIAHILAPVDPVEPVTAEIRYANEFALAYKARLSLLHVLDQTQHPTLTDEMLQQFSQEAVSDLQDNFTKAMGRLHDLGVSGERAQVVDMHVLVGSPGDEILHFITDHEVDLVVISMQRPFGAHNSVGADLVEFIAAHAPCPVLSLNDLGKSRIERTNVPARGTRVAAE